jgi:hypothetical protein
MVFQWHISEDIPFPLSGAPEGEGYFQVSSEAFDVALGNLPFYLDSAAEEPYQRATAPWRKEQFDNAREPGEQSLDDWWRRSQSSFDLGAGITYHEPLLGDGSERRFQDSRGVNVLDDPSQVTLLKALQQEIAGGATDVSVVAGAAGSTPVVLYRSGSTYTRVSATQTTNISGPAASTGAAYAGSSFLLGAPNGIHTLAGTNTSSSPLWTGDRALRPYWAKQRIFATSGPRIYQLSLAGGTFTDEDMLYEHPDPNWEWVGVVETGSAVWAAGRSGIKSAIHVIAIDPDGSIPQLTGATVAVQTADGEVINVLHSYLDFLLIGTNRGVRIAATSNTQASVGPFLFEEPVHSLAARGDYIWAGIGGGLTRRIAIGQEVGAADELRWAWANDVETGGSGDVRGIAFLGDSIAVAEAGSGLWVEGEELVASGFLTTGFIRFGTVEPKHFDTVTIVGNATSGSIGVATPTPLATLADFNGSTDVDLHQTVPTEKLALTFTLSRDSDDPTAGPAFGSYQLKALPAPTHRQRLIRLPLVAYEYEEDRWGERQGGPGFVWARIRALEDLEKSGRPFLFQDFRTGEAVRCVIDQCLFQVPEAPDRHEPNFEGSVSVTLRSLE